MFEIRSMRFRRGSTGSEGTYSMLRNSGSGPEIVLPGKILAELLPGKHRNRPSGRPSAARLRFFSGSSPAEIRPGSLIKGPEALTG
jgi:hypothetical protein